MKILYVIFFLMLWACNSKPGSDSSTEGRGIEEEPPAAWVEYKGSESLHKGQHIVLVSGDEEYRSEEALPLLGKILADQHGFDCTVLFAQDPENIGVINPNHSYNIPGLENLRNADLVILFSRFRELPGEQMQHFEDYLLAGKPIIAIRTATHAFLFQDSTHQWRHWGNQYSNSESEWDGGFGRLVLGEKWYTHHGHHRHQSTRGVFVPGQTNHPVLTGIRDGEIWGPSDVYGVRLPLPGDAAPIVLGQVVNREAEYDEEDPFYGMRPSDQGLPAESYHEESRYHPNDPMMPIVWTKTYQLPDGNAGTSLTSTIGASTDLVNEALRRLFVNACYFLLGLEVPDMASVNIDGD